MQKILLRSRSSIQQRIYFGVFRRFETWPCDPASFSNTFTLCTGSPVLLRATGCVCSHNIVQTWDPISWALNCLGKYINWLLSGCCEHESTVMWIWLLTLTPPFVDSDLYLSPPVTTIFVIDPIHPSPPETTLLVMSATFVFIIFVSLLLSLGRGSLLFLIVSSSFYLM